MSEGIENNELSRAERIAQQRRELPDSPGVYLFHGADGETLYVGKARSIRKRVNSHFSAGRVPHDLAGRPRSSAWSPRPRPRRCWPSRASSSATGRASTSACATTSPIPTSASASTRTTRASTSPARSTAPAAPTSAPSPAPSACARRSTCSASSSSSAPARARAGSALRQPLPRLLHQALRGALRRLRQRGGVPPQHRRDRRLPLRPLPPG